MDRRVMSSAHALRLASCCLALAAALALAGCGGLAAAGSAVVSGAEAVGTLVKKSVNAEDEAKGKGKATPK